MAAQVRSNAATTGAANLSTTALDAVVTYVSATIRMLVADRDIT
jgi:hypothetical protein